MKTDTIRSHTFKLCIWNFFCVIFLTFLVTRSIAQEGKLSDDEIISLAKKVYQKKSSNEKSATILRVCGSFQATTLWYALQNLSEDSPVLKQVDLIKKSAEINLEKTYGLSDFQAENGKDEKFSFTIKYTINNIENSPPLKDTDKDCHPDYVELVAQVLEISKTQFENMGFKSIGYNIHVNIVNLYDIESPNGTRIAGHTNPGKDEPILIANDLPYADLLTSPVHEFFHKIQFEYNKNNWVIGTDWIYEGTAKLSEDIIYDDVNSPYVFYVDKKLSQLEQSLIPSEIGKSYEAVLFWKYFSEQLGNPTFNAYFSQKGHTIDCRGADALKTLWEELYWAPPWGNWVSQVDDAIKILKTGKTFKGVFMDWCIANYAKDYEPESKYNYIENSLYGHLTLLNSSDFMDSWLSIANGTVNPWAAHYREYKFPIGTQKIKINASAIIESGAITDAGEIFAYFPGLKAGGAIIGTWSRKDISWYYEQELNSNGAERVCIGIAGFKNGITYNYTVSMIPMVTYPSEASKLFNTNSSINIGWNGFSGEYVKIELYKGAELNTTISNKTLNDGTFNWTIPTSILSGNDYKIRISSLSNGFDVSSSKNNFTIKSAYNPPQTLTAISGNAQCSLSWVAPTSGTPLSYKIYQSTSENVNFKAVSSTVSSKNATIKNLTNGTTYWFYIAAVYAPGEGAPSNKISVIPSVPFCEAATNLSVSNITTSVARINFSLSNSFSKATLFYKSKGASGYLSKNITKGSKYVDLTILSPSTEYSYYIKTECSNLGSGNSGEYNFKTEACVIPGAPINVTGLATGQTTATVSWSPGSPAGNNVLTYYWVIGTNSTVTYGNGVKQGFTNTNSALVTGLSIGTNYYVCVYALTSCNNTKSNYSTYASFKTLSPCITPGTPTNVKAFTDSPTTANFSWSAGIPVGTADVTYYWSVGKTSYVIYDNGLKKGTSTGTTASVTGLDPGTTYYFSVSAKSSCNNKLSAYGKSGSFKTPLKPTCDVTKVSSGSITSSSARIFFTLPQTVSTAKLEYAISATGAWSSKDLAKSGTYADLTTLKGSTKYYYRIKTQCSTGGLGTTAVYSFITLQAPYCAVATAYMASGSIGADKARIMVKLPAGIKGATLEYKIKGAGNWTQLTLTKTTTFVDLTNLSASTSYQYHVLTECINSGIGASTEYNFTTLAVPSCGAAGNLSAGSISPTGAIIKYTLPPKLLTATLEYKISENAPTLTKFLGISSTSFSLTGLIAGATYLYRIRTVCTNNLSNVSDEKSFTTIADLTVNAPATTAAISVGGESDWYKFQTGTAGVYSIHTQGGIDTRIFLFKNDLVSLIGEVKSIYNTKTGDYNGLINSNLSSNTWYYVKISGNLGSTQGFYTIEATSIKATLNLTVNAPPSPARLNADSENDWYLFQTGEAGVYTIQTYGSTDTFMEFYEGNKNNKIGEDDSSASNELYDYNAMISKRLKAYTWYYVKIKGFHSYTQGNYSIGLTDWQIFSPPLNLTSKAGNTQGTLNWQAPSAGTPLGYKVYWSTSENGTYKAISATNPTLTLPVVTLVNGTAYWFYVTAVYPKGESKASNKVRLIAINNEYKSVVLSQDETNVLATNISAADAKLNLTPPDSLSLSTLDYRNQMVETTTSINTGFRVSCYPNPANRTLFVKVSGGDEELIGLQIINLSGKVIYKSKFLGAELQAIDIQNYPTGVYILNFTKSGEVVKPVKVIFNLTK